MNNKKLNQDLGLLFKTHRAKKGFSQGEVCSILGYSSAQFLSNFERGLCAMPMKKLKAMIELYGMNGEEVAHLIISMQEKLIRQELNLKKKRK